MFLKPVFFSLALLAAPQMGQPALAQQPFTVTLSSEVEPIFEGGELRGCACNFEVGRQDSEFNRGEVVYLTGSLNYYTSTASPVFALKLGLMESVGGDFEAPEGAYLVAGNETNAAEFVQSMEGDEQGFRFFIFEPGEKTMMAVVREVADSGRLTFAYSISDGGRGAVVPVEMRNRHFDLEAPENSVFDERAPLDWINCLRDATEAISG